jgi:hypothetical protein
MFICGQEQITACPDECIIGALIGALIFLILVLDSPFRGWFAVSSEPLRSRSTDEMK